MNSIALRKLYDAHRETVEKENAKFKKMKVAEKRVVIARDVLRHLDTDLLIAGCLYGSPVGYASASKGMDLQERLYEEAQSCHACAKGALVFSAILRCNSVKGSYFDGQARPKEFPEKMWDAIEKVYQLWSDSDLSPIAMDRFNSATGLSRETRLRRIMEFIIEHKGHFNAKRFLDQY